MQCTNPAKPDENAAENAPLRIADMRHRIAPAFIPESGGKS
jgi:hypothetical protein